MDPEQSAAAPAEEDTTLANSDVTTKYQEASKIVNAVLRDVAAMCVPGAVVLDICKAGDALIVEKTAAIFKKNKGMEKGIAFPTCISSNERVCHVSPLESDEPIVLAVNDVVRIDMGVHIDGYPSVAATTVVVGAATPVRGPLANCFAAATATANAIVRLLSAGATNSSVTNAIASIPASFGVNPVHGTVMHQMKRYVLDGPKLIVLAADPAHPIEEVTFEPYEVYAVDIAMSTGDGKPKEADGRTTTIFKRHPTTTYNLKLKAARSLYSEIAKSHPSLPFTLRGIGEERSVKLGAKECVTHQLLVPYPMLLEKQGESVVHIKFTVLLLQNGTVKVTGLDIPEGYFVADEDKTVTPEVAEILAREIPSKKKTKKAAASSA